MLSFPKLLLYPGVDTLSELCCTSPYLFLLPPADFRLSPASSVCDWLQLTGSGPSASEEPITRAKTLS